MADGKSIKAGGAFFELSLKDDKLAKGLRESAKRLKEFGKKVREVGKHIGEFGLALKAPFAAAEAIFVSTGESLFHLSEQTGIGVEALSSLGYAAKMSGVDTETLGHALGKMQKSIGEAERGSDEAIDAFALLGVSLGDISKLPADQQFEAIAEKISSIPGPAEQAAAAMAVFGRSGAELLPLLKEGAQGIDAYIRRARELGLVMSEADAQEAHNLSQAFTTLKESVYACAVKIGAALGTNLEDLMDRVAKCMASITKWISKNKGLIISASKIAAGVIAAGAGIYGMGLALRGLSAALSIAGVGVSLFTTAVGIASSAIGFLLSPIGLVVGAIAGVGGYFLATSSAVHRAVGGMGASFAAMKQDFSAAWGGIGDALAAGDLGLAAKLAFTGLRVAMLEGVAGLAKSVGGDMGDFIGKLGGQILSGDLSGAWSTVTSLLGSIWADFCADIFNVFKPIVHQVTDLWNTAVSKIAKGILWVDAQRQGSNTQDMLDKAQELEAARQKFMAEHPENETDEHGQIRAADNTTTLDTLGKGLDQIADTRTKAVDQGMSDATKAAEKRADAARAAFHHTVQGGAAGENAALVAAKDELAAMIAKAAAEHQAMKDAANKKKPKPGSDADSALQHSVVGTFNKAAAMALGRGGVSPIVSHIQATNNKLDRIAGILKQAGPLVFAG